MTIKSSQYARNPNKGRGNRMNNPVAHINMLANTPWLNREEERHLIKMAQSGDEKAKNDFIKANLKLVLKMVLGFPGLRNNESIELSDLFQECSLKLWKALEKFDLEKGYRFSTYAAWWIRNAIYETLSRNYKIGIPRYVLDIIRIYYREVNKTLDIDGALPSMEVIAEKIGIPIKKMRELLRLFHEAETISMDNDIDTTKDKWDSNPISYYFHDKKNPSAEKLVQMKQLSEKARKMLLTLTPREEKVLRMRFGIGEKSDHSLEKTGKAFSITREMTRQIEEKALEKLYRKFVLGGFRKEDFRFNEYV